MFPTSMRFRRYATPFFLALGLTACGGSSTLRVETRSEPTPITAAAVTGVPGTSTTPQTSTSVPTGPSATAAPAGTPLPATPAPVIGSIEFKPPALVQGGTTIVYLNENATSATLRFQDRQYPMLHDGNRWWAMVGVGAFTQPGVLAASITYTPAGRTQSTTVAASISITKREFPVENTELDDDTAAGVQVELVMLLAGYERARIRGAA